MVGSELHGVTIVDSVVVVVLHGNAIVSSSVLLIDTVSWTWVGESKQLADEKQSRNV
jgi:hypothetical protein